VKLTIEEKSIVSRYLSEDMSLKGALNTFWPWLIPLIALSLHGVIEENFVSSSMANFLFLFYAYWFFNQSSKDGGHLKSALKKYEDDVSALGE